MSYTDERLAEQKARDEITKNFRIVVCFSRDESGAEAIVAASLEKGEDDVIRANVIRLFKVSDWDDSNITVFLEELVDSLNDYLRSEFNFEFYPAPSFITMLIDNEMQNECRQTNFLFNGIGEKDYNITRFLDCDHESFTFISIRNSHIYRANRFIKQGIITFDSTIGEIGELQPNTALGQALALLTTAIKPKKKVATLGKEWEELSTIFENVAKRYY